jgi:hypothetical protein
MAFYFVQMNLAYIPINFYSNKRHLGSYLPFSYSNYFGQLSHPIDFDTGLDLGN